MSWAWSTGGLRVAMGNGLVNRLRDVRITYFALKLSVGWLKTWENLEKVSDKFFEVSICQKEKGPANQKLR